MITHFLGHHCSRSERRDEKNYVYYLLITLKLYNSLKHSISCLSHTKLTFTPFPFQCYFSLSQRCLKAFDPLAHARLVSEQRARLDAALDAARETLRQQIADAAARGARLTVTRNYCGQLLEPHLGRFPDAPEVEELWTLQYMFPLATWEEGGEYSRDARDAAAANAFGQSGNDCL